MSPKRLWLVLPVFFALLSTPTAARSMEALTALATPPTASSEIAREARNDAAQVQNAVLVGKDFRVDLSRQPRPWTYGPFQLAAFHVFPTQMPGPYIGPPGKLWDWGFGTSLWRNAVTGWPES